MMMGRGSVSIAREKYVGQFCLGQGALSGSAKSGPCHGPHDFHRFDRNGYPPIRY